MSISTTTAVPSPIRTPRFSRPASNSAYQPPPIGDRDRPALCGRCRVQPGSSPVSSQMNAPPGQSRARQMLTKAPPSLCSVSPSRTTAFRSPRPPCSRRAERRISDTTRPYSGSTLRGMLVAGEAEPFAENVHTRQTAVDGLRLRKTIASPRIPERESSPKIFNLPVLSLPTEFPFILTPANQPRLPPSNTRRRPSSTGAFIRAIGGTRSIQVDITTA